MTHRLIFGCLIATLATARYGTPFLYHYLTIGSLVAGFLVLSQTFRHKIKASTPGRETLTYLIMYFVIACSWPFYLRETQLV
jgi:hypothetical protein